MRPFSLTPEPHYFILVIIYVHVHTLSHVFRLCLLVANLERKMKLLNTQEDSVSLREEM